MSNQDPLTLKETVIDFADCNSTLGHFGGAPVAGALNLGVGEGYTGLYQQIAAKGLEYQNLQGKPGKALHKLIPVFHSNRYWHRYFVSDDSDSYADLVWEKLVPIEARLAFHLTVSPGNAAQVKISPVPRVLLYPFGWSTWISFRITGAYKLDELAELVHRLAEEPVYTLDPGPSTPQTLRQVFRHVASGVWEDVFGGGKNKASNLPEVLSVITVLDKFGGVPTLNGLSKEHEAALRRLVQPFGDGSAKPLNDLKRGLPKGGEGAGNRDYALQEDYSVFIWADHLLKSDDRNRRLRCYHNNTFLALLQAWQLTFFLQKAVDVKAKTNPLNELVKQAIAHVERPLTAKNLYYRNRCLISFLQRPEVQSAANDAGTAFGLKPANPKGP